MHNYDYDYGPKKNNAKKTKTTTTTRARFKTQCLTARVSIIILNPAKLVRLSRFLFILF